MTPGSLSLFLSFSLSLFVALFSETDHHFNGVGVGVGFGVECYVHIEVMCPSSSFAYENLQYCSVQDFEDIPHHHYYKDNNGIG